MRTDTATFASLLIGVVVLVGALTFVPALLLVLAAPAFALEPGTGFVTEGIKPAQTTFSLGFGVNFFNLGPMTASLTGEYQTGLGQSFHSVSGFGQIRFQF